MAGEKNFENRIKKFLEDEGCYFIKHFANAYTKSGIPDLLVCCNGNFVAVEVKASNGKPSELQLYNIHKINEAGGFGVIVCPEQFDDLKEVIKCLKCLSRSHARVMCEQINERWMKKWHKYHTAE